MTDNQLLVDTSDVVHIDNEETIIGTKTFSRDTVVKNLSPMMTNCITEIPQDIKLELNNGTLTLKAGSKVYVPNGSGVFDMVTTAQDYTVSVGAPTGKRTLFFLTNGAFFVANQNINLYSGTTAPTPSTASAYWYDTTNNLIKNTNNTGSTWNTVTGATLPIAIVTFSSGTGITSIDQVFNGFGYIGSTVFALPGVKGLIPNGRNLDGTLKNIEFTTDKVLTYTTSFDYNSDNNFKFAYTNGVLSLTQGYITYWFEGSLKNIPPKQYGHLLNTDDNNWYYCPNGNAWIIDPVKYCIYTGNCGLDTNGIITSFRPKTPFHAVDWNDKSTIAGFSMPSNKYIDLTLGASGATYTAPANGWFYFAKIASTSNQYMTMYVDNGDPPIFATTITQPIDGGQARLFLPVKKGDVVGVSYNLAGETRRFCFVYAEGEV